MLLFLILLFYIVPLIVNCLYAYYSVKDERFASDMEIKTWVGVITFIIVSVIPCLNLLIAVCGFIVLLSNKHWDTYKWRLH